jgi:hypothetical protein
MHYAYYSNERLTLYVQCGQSALRFPARPVHREGTCQLRGWVGELHRAADSRRDPAVL